MGDLSVELYGIPVGSLVGTNARTFDFKAAPSGYEAFGLGATILSESVPLEAIGNRGRATRRRNFFTELLPEGDQRMYLAQQAKLSVGDTIPLLAHYGRDVAGAIQIWDPLDPGEPRVPFAVPVDDSVVATMLRDVRAYPLGNTAETGKSLVNGVQTKIVLVREQGRWKRPGDGYASTHILKPQLIESSSTVFDEEYGSRLARLLGLAVHDTEIRCFDGVATLVVERYDRTSMSPDGRIHQEDMNQALGAAGNEKYQKFGGRVSLARIASLLRAATDDDSLRRFARLSVLALAVGNLDLHAKNVSMLHPYDGRRVLAPAYDVVPMAHLENDHDMALAVNDKYAHAALTAADMEAEIAGWGMRGAAGIVGDTLEELEALLTVQTPLDGAWVGLHDDLLAFTGNLLAGRPAGSSLRFA